jgi:hypothetical protein
MTIMTLWRELLGPRLTPECRKAWKVIAAFAMKGQEEYSVKRNALMCNGGLGNVRSITATRSAPVCSHTSIIISYEENELMPDFIRIFDERGLSAEEQEAVCAAAELIQAFFSKAARKAQKAEEKKKILLRSFVRAAEQCLTTKTEEDL